MQQGNGKLKVIYVASPYSDLSLQVREQRVIETMRYCYQLITDNKCPYSPIVHFHSIARRWGMDYSATFWQAINKEMLSRCDEMHVLSLDGWEKSIGIQSEIRFAAKLRIPIITVTPV